jgi:hypothetical protein
MDENIGGTIGFGDEVPPFEDAVPVFEKRDKKADKVKAVNYVGTKPLLSGGDALKKEMMRLVNLYGKTPEKGLRVFVCTGGPDTNTPASSFEEYFRLGKTLLKYPLAPQ